MMINGQTIRILPPSATSISHCLSLYKRRQKGFLRVQSGALICRNDVPHRLSWKDCTLVLFQCSILKARESILYIKQTLSREPILYNIQNLYTLNAEAFLCFFVEVGNESLVAMVIEFQGITILRLGLFPPISAVCQRGGIADFVSELSKNGFWSFIRRMETREEKQQQQQK